jgi:hypothetical protein
MLVYLVFMLNSVKQKREVYILIISWHKVVNLEIGMMFLTFTGKVS